MRYTHCQPQLRAVYNQQAANIQSTLRELQLILSSFDPNQLRIPRGQFGGGRWTSINEYSENPDYIINLQQIAGGFDPDDMDMSVQRFSSENCVGGVQRILPGEFLDAKIKDVMDLAKSGDIRARRCMKLLRQDRFRK